MRAGGRLDKDEAQGGTLQVLGQGASAEAAVGAAGQLKQLGLDTRGCRGKQQLKALAQGNARLEQQLHPALHLLQGCGILGVWEGQAGVPAWVARCSRA